MKITVAQPNYYCLKDNPDGKILEIWVKLSEMCL